MRQHSLFIATLFALATVSAVHAQSISISGTSISKLAGNTGNFQNGNGATIDGEQFISNVELLDAGGSAVGTVGASVNASGRYSAVAIADSAAPLGSSTVNATSSYQFGFSINASPELVYDISIQTNRRGALTWIDDVAQPEPATAGLGAVQGQLNGSSNAGLGLGSIANVTREGDFNAPFDQSNTLTLTGLTGDQVINLQFLWTNYANSEATFFTGADEAAVRLGIDATLASSSAGDYPGLGNRLITGDGHFVTVTATVTAVVPEVGSVLLTGLAIAGAAVARFARRRS